jgi:uncharacterized membrane protein YdcZ (DUF606 family)
MIYALIERQAMLWAVSRVVNGILLVVQGSDTTTAKQSAIAPLVPQLLHWQPGTILLACILGVVEHFRLRERVLLGNLGISTAQFLTIVLLSSVAFETAFTLAMRVAFR